jgi:hypothetical protein
MPTGSEWRETRMKFEEINFLMSVLEKKPLRIDIAGEVGKGWGTDDAFDDDGVFPFTGTRHL